ncbi:transcriptional regulator [Actinomadura darangshiensis]|uniref:Transcriptional regulator n=2 Tax=Actinomadura darangshiensis TaxID=705336 RepID=A0A4R5B9M9_9ACTN|nr:transcriptional regulator [Actinomadura darangshiensis]
MVRTPSESAQEGTFSCPGHLERTMEHTEIGCRAREILDRVGDKWSLQVISLLGERTKRFTELKREIDGISQRMLTVTLRGLERDGIVIRTVYPVVPPRVEYSLTPMGATLMEAASTLVSWAESHLAQIDAARAEYDARRNEMPPGSAVG